MSNLINIEISGVFVPTIHEIQGSSDIYLNKKTNKFNFGFVQNKFNYNHHLYVLSNCVIIKSDWSYDVVEGIVSQCLRTDENGYWNKNCKKIIFSTNSHLDLPMPVLEIINLCIDKYNNK